MTDTTVEAPATPRLKQKYNEQIVPELEKEFHYSNRCRSLASRRSSSPWAWRRSSRLQAHRRRCQGPHSDHRPEAEDHQAKKSVAQFHLREGQAIGAYVTLRGERMWEFLDRLLTMALPRIRDFRGINGDQFDGQGNYNLALPSSPCSTRSIRIRSITSVVWTSPW